MITIKSHPDISLDEHIAQVKMAADNLLEWHSEVVVSPAVRGLLYEAINLHDIGKTTEAFQKYISNPMAYTDDPREKMHSPLSTLIALLIAKREEWNMLDTLLITAVINGHHKGLPSLEKLREIGNSSIAQVLKRQLSTLPFDIIKNEYGVDISFINSIDRPWSKAKHYIEDMIIPVFENLTIEEGVHFRLKTQLVFSILLEADKALLALKEPEVYLHRETKCWKAKWVEERIGAPVESSVNNVRKAIRNQLLEHIGTFNNSGIFSLTAPTGSGKTLLSATWILTLREKIGKKGVCPKIIIVLPFLSVIDQVTQEYKTLLKIGGEKYDGSWFLTSHSLSDRTYHAGLEEGTEYFFIDTWRTELVITTYDQFLMTLMDQRTKYQMRFHNLNDALIVMDEVQSLPCRLWKPLEKMLSSLVKTGNTNILLMSATLPSIIPEARPLIENYNVYFEQFNRYSLNLEINNPKSIQAFCDEIIKQLESWLIEEKRVLVTLNTRGSARIVRDRLAENWPEQYYCVPLFFISAGVTPSDRIKIIKSIKTNQPCVVVSTQCIEAGVDIDMDFVIRDFAPLDSLIQIAGRCNRNGAKAVKAIVKVVDLVNEKGKRYSEMIYDDIHLQVTRQLIRGDIDENQILPYALKYFEILSERKSLGENHIKKFARWEDDDPVRELLKGKEREKYTFLVLKQDPDLREAMERANIIEDRWKRKEAWRALAGRIAKISVSIFAKLGFKPQNIAEEYLGQWLLYDNFYSSDKGIILPTDLDNDTMIW